MSSRWARRVSTSPANAPTPVRRSCNAVTSNATRIGSFSFHSVPWDVRLRRTESRMKPPVGKMPTPPADGGKAGGVERAPVERGDDRRARFRTGSGGAATDHLAGLVAGILGGGAGLLGDLTRLLGQPLFELVEQRVEAGL